MTRTRQSAEVARFRALLAEQLGWTFTDVDTRQLANALDLRAGELKLSHGEYLRWLTNGRPAEELAALAETLTITETYFFRHSDQFNALGEVALPHRVRSRASHHHLRLLSVGCSSGEEAYSLAITAHEAQPDPAWQITVLGLDANPAMLQRAAVARYSEWSLRETPTTTRRRWFTAHDNAVEVDSRIRATVTFRQYNVVDDDPVWHVGDLDVVFCRNLLMYLTPVAAQVLVGRMTRALAPGGYLFLGHTDTLGSDPAGLEQQHARNAFFYRRPESAAPPYARPAFPPRPGDSAALARPTATTAVGGPRASTVRPVSPTAIRSAAASLTSFGTASKGWAGATLAGRETTSRETAGRTASDRRRVDPAVRQQALTLLRGEQFAAALAVVEASLPIPGRPGERGSPDRSIGLPPADLLLYGVLLAQVGHPDAAAVVARQLLDLDGRHADAHHLLGMCLDDGAAVDSATGHYQRAAYLDPQFALPRLRLGLLARRRGDRRGATVELEAALDLLRYEHDERVTLFGGGFSRSSLIALCQSELGVLRAYR